MAFSGSSSEESEIKSGGVGFLRRTAALLVAFLIGGALAVIVSHTTAASPLAAGQVRTAAKLVRLAGNLGKPLPQRHSGSLVLPLEVVVGDVRVQALSPRLLRVEPRGPMGFENRATFMVADRNFVGLNVSTVHVEDGWFVDTEYYRVHVRDKCSAQASTSGPCFSVYSLSREHGEVLYTTSKPVQTLANLLQWPPPLSALGYAVTDYPRFHVPTWGAAPAPNYVDPELRSTNGYDFRNNVPGDTYVFLLGSDLGAWAAARLDFLHLTGTIPLLPDFAYGTWFSWWHPWTDSEVREDVMQWSRYKLPLDVWGVDVNWRRDTPPYGKDKRSWYYLSNKTLVSNWTQLFKYFEASKLHTLFNDHPYPVAARGAGGLQTSPEEVAFRWKGLTSWMKRGLTFWWFDLNWDFSIPPPNMATASTDVMQTPPHNTWLGLDNAAWGSHVYFTITQYYDRMMRDKEGSKLYGGHPMVLSKFALFHGREGLTHFQYAESPAHHRYPVWWSGDGVTLKTSIETMVDAGVYDVKPFVHSDCGGDHKTSPGMFLRWIAHCAFGTILRVHGAEFDHRPWLYDTRTLNTVRSYLEVRYRLVPSLIAGGHRATKTGFPLVARGDLYWPEHVASSSSHQYIFLDDILVAPIWETKNTSRSVWLPPGSWEDAWNGSVVTGPKTIHVTQPYERLPMWFRHEGALLVVADNASLRVESQDWSSLTLEAFPSSSPVCTLRALFERVTAARTDIRLCSHSNGKIRLDISKAGDGTSRKWVLRLHLRPGQLAFCSTVDGRPCVSRSLAPLASPTFFPLAGAGSAPAEFSGLVLEVDIPAGANARVVEATIGGSPMD